MRRSSGVPGRRPEPQHGGGQRGAADVRRHAAVLRRLPAALEEHPQLLEMVRVHGPFFSTSNTAILHAWQVITSMLFWRTQLRMWPRCVL